MLAPEINPPAPDPSWEHFSDEIALLGARRVGRGSCVKVQTQSKLRLSANLSDEIALLGARRVGRGSCVKVQTQSKLRFSANRSLTDCVAETTSPTRRAAHCRATDCGSAPAPRAESISHSRDSADRTRAENRSRCNAARPRNRRRLASRRDI